MATRLKRFREERKLSQRELSRLTGIEQATISRIERGEMTLMSPHVTKLSHVLGVSISRLLGIVSNVIPGQVGSRRIPILDYTQLGNFSGVEQHIQDGAMSSFVLSDLPRSTNTFAMYVRGDSMEPLFIEGDLVIIDPEVDVRPGDFVVASSVEGESVFRRYRDLGIKTDGNRTFELVPLNALHAGIRSDQHELTITGVMVEHRRYRRR